MERDGTEITVTKMERDGTEITVTKMERNGTKIPVTGTERDGTGCTRGILPMESGTRFRSVPLAYGRKGREGNGTGNWNGIQA